MADGFGMHTSHMWQREHNEREAEIFRQAHNAYVRGVMMRCAGLPINKCPFRARTVEGDNFEMGWGLVDDTVAGLERGSADRGHLAALEAALRTTLPWCPDCKGARGFPGMGPREPSWVPCLRCGPIGALLAGGGGESGTEEGT